MKKILIFPLLNSMPSGHHQVAAALREAVSAYSPETEIRQADLLSEWSRFAETAAVKTYLAWIRHSPKTYARVYRKTACTPRKNEGHPYYERLFMKTVKSILEREQPDLIVCTHGFPSLFINKLKQNGTLKTPCLNVYTDFFMHELWGKSHIDCHFVPSRPLKEQLQKEYGIAQSRIFVTGIPVSRQFGKTLFQPLDSSRFSILISGGSTGLINTGELLEKTAVYPDCRFRVLCGTNTRLFEKIRKAENEALVPLSYISSKEEMNRLYSSSDAIITKPGGVTVSEALKKELPIFVPTALPGQEEINLQFLSEQGLVLRVPDGADLIHFVCRTLQDEGRMKQYRNAVKAYNASVELTAPKALSEMIESMMPAG